MKNNKLLLVNLITSLRLVGAFLLIPIFLNAGPVATGLSFLAFMGTDWIDGFLARKFHVSTFLGAILDGLVDKAFAGISLVLLATLIPQMLLPLLLEIAILLYGIRSIKKGNSAGSSLIGKLKVWIMAFCVTLGFLASDYTTLQTALNFINAPALDPKRVANILNLSTNIAITAEAATLTSYVARDLTESRQKRVSYESLKEQLNRQKEELLYLKEHMISKEEVMKKLIDPNYYTEHKNDDILKLLLRKDETHDKLSY